MKVIKVICTLFIFGFVSVSHAAVIFITEKDANAVTSLLGADNVEVNGLFYNVRFLDGTCIELFNGCDNADDFVFNTSDTAFAAANALLDLVFIDGVDGNFDTNPELTNGCVGSRACFIDSPGFVPRLKSSRFRFVRIINRDEERRRKVDGYTTELVEPELDFRSNGARTYAVWSEAVEASAPGTAMILLMGIAGLLVSQRRKQA